jgi:hypothetical protein
MSGLKRVMGCPPGVSHEAFALFSQAVEWARGMRVLAGSSEDVDGTMWFLRGWVVEFALKAFLAHRGMSVLTLKDYGHDLEKLWRRCVSEGLRIDPQPPAYCADHRDMLQRYRQGRAGTDTGPYFGIHIVGDDSEVADELQRIVDAVGAQMLGDDFRDHEPPTLWAKIEPPTIPGGPDESP